MVRGDGCQPRGRRFDTQWGSEKVPGQLQLCVPHCWGVLFTCGKDSFGHGFDLQSIDFVFRIASAYAHQSASPATAWPSLFAMVDYGWLTIAGNGWHWLTMVDLHFSLTTLQSSTHVPVALLASPCKDVDFIHIIKKIQHWRQFDKNKSVFKHLPLARARSCLTLW